MIVRTFILFGILAVLVGAIFVSFHEIDDEPAVQAEIQQLVQTYDNSIYLNSDYEAAKNAANEIVSLAEKSDDSNATEARGLIRLAYLEIAVGKWGNRWRKKIKRCEELVSTEPTIARAEFLLYSGVIKGKYQSKFDEGIKRVETALHISEDLKDDRILALAYTNLGELYNFAGRRRSVAENSYRGAMIAKHHGQKSVLARTLRNLINELVFLGNFSEAAACGKEILKIEPQATDGLFTLFLAGESDRYIDLIEGYVKQVKTKEKEGSATNLDFAVVGRSLKKLAMACAIRDKYPECGKYAELAIPYLKIVGDKTSLNGCEELLNAARLDQANTVDEVNLIAAKFDTPSEISKTALATAYARVGEFKKSLDFSAQIGESNKQRIKSEFGFLKHSSDVFWASEVNSRQAELSDKFAAESQRRVWLLSSALIMGLTTSVLLGGFYLLIRRERNSLEDTVKKRTESLSKAMEAASSADRAKSDFLAQINHEIRNPLTAILGYCDLLSLSKDKSLEYIAGIESSSSHLRELVDKILEVSKIESNGLDLNYSDFLPAQTTSGINDIMLEQAIKKDLRFACTFCGDASCSIYSDETKIRQIALNLTGNAIKFTESGSVTVSFELNKQSASLLIVVKDSGIGIAEEEIQTVFERFAKASNGITCDGSGLGLFITSQLVKRLGGEIELDSKLNIGTQVSVSLPVTLTCEDSLNSDSTNSYDAIDSGISVANPGSRVILVDDQEIIRTSMKLLLNANRIQCKTAENLEQTMELIEKWQPDLVLLDLRMPKHSGYEVFERIRQSNNADVPVYAMTGDATSQVKEKCLSLGFDGFITKPFKIQTIQEILEASSKVS